MLRVNTLFQDEDPVVVARPQPDGDFSVRGEKHQLTRSDAASVVLCWPTDSRAPHFPVDCGAPKAELSGGFSG